MWLKAAKWAYVAAGLEKKIQPKREQEPDPPLKQLFP